RGALFSYACSLLSINSRISSRTSDSSPSKRDSLSLRSLYRSSTALSTNSIRFLLSGLRLFIQRFPCLPKLRVGLGALFARLGRLRAISKALTHHALRSCRPGVRLHACAPLRFA